MRIVSVVAGLKHVVIEGDQSLVEAGAVVRFADGVVVEVVAGYTLRRIRDARAETRSVWVRDDYHPQGTLRTVVDRPGRRVVNIPYGAALPGDVLRRVAEQAPADF